jgi:hypothetical protein
MVSAPYEVDGEQKAKTMLFSDAVAGKQCKVTYKDLEGVFHSVEVTAESVYEASVLALSALSKHEWIENVGPGTRLEIQVIEPGVTHLLLVAQLRQWLDTPARSPADVMKKQKLKAMLAG